MPLGLVQGADVQCKCKESNMLLKEVPVMCFRAETMNGKGQMQELNDASSLSDCVNGQTISGNL